MQIAQQEKGQGWRKVFIGNYVLRSLLNRGLDRH